MSIGKGPEKARLPRLTQPALFLFLCYIWNDISDVSAKATIRILSPSLPEQGRVSFAHEIRFCCGFERCAWQPARVTAVRGAGAGLCASIFGRASGLRAAYDVTAQCVFNQSDAVP